MTAIVEWLPVSLPLAVLATSAAYLLYTVLGRRTAHQFVQQVRRLPARQQLAVLLAAYGWSYAEIALVLDCTTMEVATLIHGGREALRHAHA